MSRTKLLLDVIEAVRSLADSLQAVADAMMSDEPQVESTEKISPKKVTKVSAKAEPEEKSLSLEDVRSVLADKSRKGKTAAVKELLIKYGANKLSDIDHANYAALLADAEVL